MAKKKAKATKLKNLKTKSTSKNVKGGALMLSNPTLGGGLLPPVLRPMPRFGGGIYSQTTTNPTSSDGCCGAG